jgi:hypothetical protein
MRERGHLDRPTDAEVLRELNGLGMTTKEFQEHAGVKDANSLYVGYNFDDTAASGAFTKGMRPKSVRLPNGRLVHYTYGSAGSIADCLARLDAIQDDSSGSPGAVLAAYSYLGARMLVIEDFQEPDLKLDYFGGTSGTYAGLDNFNRVIAQLWRDYGASVDRDKYTYGYDRASVTVKY